MFAARFTRTALTAVTPKMTFPTPSMMQFKPTFPMLTQPLFTPTPVSSPLTTFARMMATSRTYQPSVKKRKSTHGFLRRLKSRGGRHVLTRRREKGRWKVGI